MISKIQSETCSKCKGKGRYAVNRRMVGDKQIYPENYGWRELHEGLLLDERGNVLMPGCVLVFCEKCEVEAS